MTSCVSIRIKNNWIEGGKVWILWQKYRILISDMPVKHIRCPTDFFVCKRILDFYFRSFLPTMIFNQVKRRFSLKIPRITGPGCQLPCRLSVFSQMGTRAPAKGLKSQEKSASANMLMKIVFNFFVVRFRCCCCLRSFHSSGRLISLLIKLNI